MEQNTLLIIAGVVVFLLIVFLMPWGKKGCNCGEGFSSSQNAKFPVNHPKSMVPTTHPMKNPQTREGFIVPIPKQSQMVGAPNNMKAGTIGPTANPWMGGLPGEALHGTSVAAANSPTLTIGNGAGQPGSMNTWKTVI